MTVLQKTLFIPYSESLSGTDAIFLGWNLRPKLTRESENEREKKLNHYHDEDGDGDDTDNDDTDNDDTDKDDDDDIREGPWAP